MTTVSSEDECARQGECVHQALAGKAEPMPGASVEGNAYKKFATKVLEELKSHFGNDDAT